MKTLYIGKTWPEPASTAAGRRTLDILTTLQQAGEVHCASAARPTEHSQDLAPLGIQSHTIALNDDGFDTWLAELAPDCVVFERFMTEEQFGWRVARTCPDALRVLDTSDLHCLRDARTRQVKQGLAEPDLFNDLALREVAAIVRCDLTLMISPYETELLQSRFGLSADLLHTTGFMLTPLPPQAQLAPFDLREHLIVLGNFLHEPNRDAVRWLRQYWPQWRKRFPEGTEVHVYGGYADAAIEQQHAPSEAFHIKGRAGDALATLSRYRVNLAYLRFGAGIKGKIADAWLAGTPSAANTIAAEGMHGGLPWGSDIADDPDEWIEQAARLYRDPDAWQAAVDQGRRIAAQCHDTTTQQQALLARLAECRAHLSQHRHRNLWGRLLAQQQYRASEYFSRWITLKNHPS